MVNLLSRVTFFIFIFLTKSIIFITFNTYQIIRKIFFIQFTMGYIRRVLTLRILHARIVSTIISILTFQTNRPIIAIITCRYTIINRNIITFFNFSIENIPIRFLAFIALYYLLNFVIIIFTTSLYYRIFLTLSIY